jgi:hypothetical protein
MELEDGETIDHYPIENNSTIDLDVLSNHD